MLVTSGAQDLGTGTRTYVRAIVVEELGLNIEDVLEEIGESRFGNAVQSGGSTTTASLAPAVKDAAFNAQGDGGEGCSGAGGEAGGCGVCRSEGDGEWEGADVGAGLPGAAGGGIGG